MELLIISAEKNLFQKKLIIIFKSIFTRGPILRTFCKTIINKFRAVTILSQNCCMHKPAQNCQKPHKTSARNRRKESKTIKEKNLSTGTHCQKPPNMTDNRLKSQKIIQNPQCPKPHKGVQNRQKLKTAQNLPKI